MPASSQDSPSASRHTSLPTLLLSGLCALSGWGCPAAQVLPTGGDPCPEEAQNFMFNELGLTEGSELMILFDIHQPGETDQEGIYAPGPIVGRVVQHTFTHPALGLELEATLVGVHS